MNIRDEAAWCDECTAPIVLAANLAPITLFADALPEWRSGEWLGGRPGFAREGVLALMDLRGTPAHDRPEQWEAILELEAEMRDYLAEQQSRAKSEV